MVERAREVAAGADFDLAQVRAGPEGVEGAVDAPATKFSPESSDRPTRVSLPQGTSCVVELDAQPDALERGAQPASIPPGKGCPSSLCRGSTLSNHGC